MSKIVISATGLYTPPHSISNEELVGTFNTYVERFNERNAAAIADGTEEALAPSSTGFIEKASGIKARYVVDKDGILDPEMMCPHLPERPNSALALLAEIGVNAAKDALRSSGNDPHDIDGVIVACSNLQRAYPAVAVEIQDALGIDGFGFDMNVACSSATFGIQAAGDMIRSGSARRLLVINPEICSSHLNWRDRDSHFIFGDVATATILEREDLAQKNGFEILGTKLKTKFSNNIRNNFGFLNRTDPKSVGTKDKLFMQEGRKVFKEVVPMVSALILEHLQTLDIAPTDVKRLWLHQANQHMNDMIGKRVLGRVASALEAPIILDEYANTSSAGSIIAFHKYSDDLAPGDLGVICSFGAGYSTGSVVLRKRP